MARQFWKPGNMLYPLPAVMVSCRRGEEKPNIITVAWAGTICTNPAMLSISVRPERYSYDIIRESGEFVVNLVTRDLVCAADYCGVKSGREVDKFKQLGLHPSETRVVHAPAIEESPVNIECKVKEIKELGSHHMFIAEVVSVDIDDAYLDNTGRFHLNDSMPVVYSHGEYFEPGKRLGSFGYSVKKNPAQNPVKKSVSKKRQERGKTDKKALKKGSVGRASGNLGKNSDSSRNSDKKKKRR